MRFLRRRKTKDDARKGDPDSVENETYSYSEAYIRRYTKNVYKRIRDVKINNKCLWILTDSNISVTVVAIKERMEETSCGLP